jgi:hypothetical protein
VVIRPCARRPDHSEQAQRILSEEPPRMETGEDATRYAKHGWSANGRIRRVRVFMDRDAALEAAGLRE